MPVEAVLHQGILEQMPSVVLVVAEPEVVLVTQLVALLIQALVAVVLMLM
jgi:hypothetical protein